MRPAFALAALSLSAPACTGAGSPSARPDAAPEDAAPADAMPVDAAAPPDAERPDAYTGPCRATPDCFDARPPLRCVGVWRCDPDDTHESSAPGPDGCRYTCVTRLTPCSPTEASPCPPEDACLPCPAGPQCGVAAVCVDPAYADAPE